MPYRLTCPHCEAALQAEESTSAKWVICPRCMQRFPNPGFISATIWGEPEIQAVRLEDDAVVMAPATARSGCFHALAVLGSIASLLLWASIASKKGWSPLFVLLTMFFPQIVLGFAYLMRWYDDRLIRRLGFFVICLFAGAGIVGGAVVLPLFCLLYLLFR